MFTNSSAAGDPAEALRAPHPAATIAAYWRDWQRGEYPSTRSATARSHLAQLRRPLSDAARSSADGNGILIGFDSVVRQATAGAHLFATLAGNPSAMRTLLELVSLAPRLTPTIASRPDAFDALIARRPSVDAMSLESVMRALALQDYEDEAEHLSRIRRFTREHQFLIGARAMLGWMPLAEAERAFSRLALAVVNELVRAVEKQMVRLHGRVPGSAWALVALGKFGGLELTATSDLDLMLVYENAGDAVSSNGERPLPTPQYFNMLAKNVIAAFGSQGFDGALFEVDFRLRPWGNKGPIATQLSTLRGYLEGDSWTYEHMAMTRARVVAGPARFCAEIESAIGHALQQSATRRPLRSDMLEMHTLLHAEKETDSIWDVKHVRGGMIDIEFIAQHLMLRHAPSQPGLVRPATADALQGLGETGLLDPSDAEKLGTALSLYKTVQQATRIACAHGPLPERMSLAFARRLPGLLGETSLAMLETKLGRTQKFVRERFARLTRAD